MIPSRAGGPLPAEVGASRDPALRRWQVIVNLSVRKVEDQFAKAGWHCCRMAPTSEQNFRACARRVRAPGFARGRPHRMRGTGRSDKNEGQRDCVPAGSRSICRLTNLREFGIGPYNVTVTGTTKNQGNNAVLTFTELVLLWRETTVSRTTKQGGGRQSNCVCLSTTTGDGIMQIINNSFSFDSFLDWLGAARARVLIIDYGALAVPSDRDPWQPNRAVLRLLEQIRVQTHTRLVVISDRHCRTVDSLLGLDPVPEIWGVGDLERLLPDGSYELSSLDERALRGLAEADDWAETAGLLPWVEQKPGGIALLETTILPAEFNSTRSRAWTAWSEIAIEYGLSLLNLEHGLELRVPSRTRVEAVEAIISETHRSVPIAYLGDGVLSEFAFDALGARGMRVLVRRTFRATLADVWISPPVGLVGLLKIWLSAGQQDHTTPVCAGSADEAPGSKRGGVDQSESQGGN